jgi:hypothetical protein
MQIIYDEISFDLDDILPFYDIERDLLNEKCKFDATINKNYLKNLRMRLNEMHIRSLFELNGCT